MPEVINKQRGGIDVSRLQAREVSPTQQAQPASQNSGFLSAVSEAGNNLVGLLKDNSANEARKAKALEDARVGRAEDEIALGNEAISQGFILATEKSRVEEVSDLRKSITGEDIPPGEKAALTQIESFEKRAASALAQGVRPEAAIALERSKLRASLIQKYPGLSKEILAVSTTSNALNKEALDVEFEDDAAERARQIAADTKIAEKLSAFGVDISTSNPVQRRRIWNEKLAPHYQKLGQYQTETELLEADESLNAAQKKIARREGLTKIADDAVLLLNNDIVAAIDSAGDDDAAAIAVSGLITQREAEARALYKGSSEAEFQAAHGFIFGPARKLADDLIARKTDDVSGKSALGVARNRADLAQALAEEGFFKDRPEVRDLELINKAYGPVSDALFRIPAVKAQVTKNAIAAYKAIDNRLENQNQHTPTTGPVTENVDKRLVESKATATAAIDVLITNGAQTPASGKKAAIDSTLSRLSERENYNGYAGVMGVLELTASKQFYEEAKKITGKDEYIQTVVSYGLNTLTDPEGLFVEYQDAYDVDVTKDGKFKLIYTGDIPATKKRRMEAYAVQLGQAIRTIAHLSDSEDYENAAVGLFETDINKRRAARGVQR